MDEQHFWEIIESGGMAVLDDPDTQLIAIRKRLAQEPPAEIIDFNRLFNQKLADAFTWDLWGAAYLINGGCSDDGFYYFRAWLISRGPEVFEAAVEDPDSLASLTDPDRDDYEFEELWYVAQDVYSELTGEGMPLDPFNFPTRPQGGQWDFDHSGQVSRRLPRLAENYLA